MQTKRGIIRKIVFVFLIMAEFTLVIIIKYYLVDHMPSFCLERLLRKAPGQLNSGTRKENLNFIEDFMNKNVEKASIENTIDSLEETKIKK